MVSIANLTAPSHAAITVMTSMRGFALLSLKVANQESLGLDDDNG